MKTSVISPVRTDSSRMRGKIFWPLAGKSMLQNFIERIQRAKLIDGVAIACPPRDLDEFTKFTKGWGIKVVAPEVDESDLIGRLYLAAKMLNVDNVIRICADNPCVEPEEIDSLVSLYNPATDWERLMNSEKPDGDYDGVGGELYTIEMLERMNEKLPEPKYREHPHQFWIDMNNYRYVGKLYPRGFRLEVNTPEEYEKLKDIYDQFGHNHFTVKEVMEYLGTKNLEEWPVFT